MGVVGQLFINEVLELGLVHSLFEGVLVQQRDVRVPGQVVLREHLRLHVEADFVEQHFLVLLLLFRVLYLLVLQHLVEFVFFPLFICQGEAVCLLEDVRRFRASSIRCLR